MRPWHMAERDILIFMGGDSADHAGESRPSVHRPLPSLLPEFSLFSPNPPSSVMAPCPGELLETILLTLINHTKPYDTSNQTEDQTKPLNAYER